MTTTHGFELVRDEQIEELNTRARLYRHLKSGAELLSLENDDENKCFGVAFRTPPSDSTGIAHILEHSVLCGSRKYPVKKPFFELVKSSVKTFLNAMTYPDKTVYPVASTNLADFYNLVDVYLDAVFFPRIKPETLRQEGWRYELSAKGEPVTYGGVVFNEMKGAYSSPDSVLYRYSQQALFPDTTYGVSSGGDPRSIPDLTYEQFKRFHETLYHPSNARIFFYGDDDPERRLAILDDYLSQFEAMDPPSQIALQERFPAPREVEETYAAPADESGKKGLVTIQWMIGEEPDIERVLALGILSYILVGTSAAPLRKALIDSRLGDDLTGSGYNDGIRQHTFAVGMKGIDPADAPRVEQLVLDTLGSLAEQGIDPEQIAAALNTFEFSLRENNTGSFPRGLSLFFRALDTWIYDGDPLAPLRFEGPRAAIRARMEGGERLFEDLIRETLLENTHRLRLLLRPDAEQAERDAAQERARLDAYQATLGDADLDRLIAETAELKRMQEEPDQPEDIAKVPTLALKDLERQGKTIPTEDLASGGAPLLFHDLFTNGIVYLDLAFDLRALPAELLPFVPLFSRALTEMGTERDDFVRLVQRIGRDTGGIYASSMTATNVQSGEPLGRLVVRGKSTLGQADAMLAIIRDILLTVRLDDQERFRQIVTRAKAGRESSLVPSGNAYARQRLLARFSAAEWADEQMTGIDGLFFVRELEKRVAEDWPGVLAQLEAVRRHLVNRAALLTNVTLDADGFKSFAPALEDFVAELPAAEYAQAAWRVADAGPNEGLTIPAKVNYVAKGADVRALGVQVNGASGAVTRFLYNAYLLEKIRVQGGAYGAGSSYDRSTGTFAWSSYRDPNLLRTLDVYDGTGDFLRSVELDRLTVERSIIGTVGDMDGYQLPDSKGYTALARRLTGVTDEWRQRIREELLDATAADFRAFADAADAARDNGVIAVVGSAEAIEAANKERPGLLTPVKVL
jgi:Zn-dependent M16 (insulinase) family peptidase